MASVSSPQIGRHTDLRNPPKPASQPPFPLSTLLSSVPLEMQREYGLIFDRHDERDAKVLDGTCKVHKGWLL